MAATATAATTRSRTTSPALDGLRALAVVLVVLFHGGHLSGGFLGVDLFFVLSGYLITTLLLDEHDHTGAISLAAFWARRGRRLLPALVVMVVVTLVTILVLHDVESVTANRGEALASLLYVSNWWSLHEPAPYLTVFQHTWSLSIEAQYYLVWPVLLSVALRGARTRRRAASVVLAISGLGAVAAAVLMAVLHDGPATIARVYFGTDTRAVPILFGCSLAAGVAFTRASPLSFSRRVLDVGGVVLAAALVATTFVLERADDSLWEGAYAVVICPMLTIVVAAAALADGVFAKVLSFTPVRALGLISYGVYLWHWPVMYLGSANRLHLDGWSLLGAQFAVTVGIATASYVFVELPIRQRRRPFSRPPVPPSTSASTVR
jgi:peptidoglycan/LPS O-acetylase OafA/YrhL